MLRKCGYARILQTKRRLHGKSSHVAACVVVVYRVVIISETIKLVESTVDKPDHNGTQLSVANILYTLRRQRVHLKALPGEGLARPQ